ncbi:hypothetical protein CBR_g23420 [Chara braunii]|uniref:Mitotic-spindle organizing protein 1 n=1 Tax=Chara braunii TaxID=69332 RepID=A0A388L457_CHABU|nr:hypothetical protein CBR_g23420 [Chara braunii]|eukprot:GBG77094.1 hypothetical protein CBR_g23420 [Chara braunii]
MDAASIQQARETLDIAYEISKVLNTGLDRDMLSILISLCENGVNPEALAAVVKELRREAAALQAAEKLMPSTRSQSSGGGGGAAADH